jgi:hypothetical protein
LFERLKLICATAAQMPGSSSSAGGGYSDRAAGEIFYISAQEIFMYTIATETSRIAEPVLAAQNESLYSMLEAGINDINSGNTLTEEEMNLAIELM